MAKNNRNTTSIKDFEMNEKILFERNYRAG